METPENETTAWLQEKFENWRNQKGVKKTITEFAAHIGVTEANMLDYMSGKEIPRGSNLAKIAGMMGFDIFETMNMKPVDMLELLPPLARVRFASALIEYFELVQDRDLKKDAIETPFALKEILEKFGLHDLLS